MPRRIPTHRTPGQALAARSARRQYGSGEGRLADNRFYASAPWRKLRAVYLAEHPLCEDCERAGRLTAAEHVHHMIERKDDPSRSLDWSNLQALCASCHGRKRCKSH